MRVDDDAGLDPRWFQRERGRANAHQPSAALTPGVHGSRRLWFSAGTVAFKVADSAGSNLEPIHIVLADDHAMVRRGLRMVLDGEEGLEVVGEAADIETALHRTRELRPQVVVLDLNMPGTPTLSAIDRFIALAPMSAVVVLTITGVKYESVVNDDRQPPVRVEGEKLRRARARIADLDRIVLIFDTELHRHPERAKGAGAGDAVDT